MCILAKHFCKNCARVVQYTEGVARFITPLNGKKLATLIAAPPTSVILGSHGLLFTSLFTFQVSSTKTTFMHQCFVLFSYPAALSW